MPVLEGESGIRPLCYIVAKDKDNMFRLGLLTYYPELETWNIRWGKRQYKHLRDCYHISSTNAHHGLDRIFGALQEPFYKHP